jgi:exopolyphosphatase/guanosine-5'-triphosphate,3'-diphosphate pyrophosphatase
MINCGIDIGSNSVRMLVAEVSGGKITRVLADSRGITRLSASISSTRQLSEESMAKTFSLLFDFRKIMAENRVEKVFAAATSAVREAENADIFLQGAMDLGINIKIITGEEEARYNFYGVAAFNTDYENLLVFDIGGGSTELTLARSGEIVHSFSVPIGVVKLCDIFGFNGVNTAEKRVKAEEYINYAFGDSFSRIKEEGETAFLVGSAGTLTSLTAFELALPQFDAAAVDKFILSLDVLDSIEQKLNGLYPEEILEQQGVEKGREDLLAPGAVLVKTILKGLGKKSCRVAVHGLKEGLAIHAEEPFLI